MMYLYCIEDLVTTVESSTIPQVESIVELSSSSSNNSKHESAIHLYLFIYGASNFLGMPLSACAETPTRRRDSMAVAPMEPLRILSSLDDSGESSDSSFELEN